MDGSHSFTGLESPLELQEVKAPRFSGQSTLESDKVVNPTHQPPLSQEILADMLKKLEILFKPMPPRSPGFACLFFW
jgi:hypothetical protein